MRTRTHRIQVWLNDEEYAQLKKDVGKTPYAMEVFIRLLIEHSLTGTIRTRLKRRLFGTFPLFDFDGRQPACNLKAGNLLKNPFFSGRRVSAERICR